MNKEEENELNAINWHYYFEIIMNITKYSINYI